MKEKEKNIKLKNIKATKKKKENNTRIIIYLGNFSVVYYFIKIICNYVAWKMNKV